MVVKTPKQQYPYVYKYTPPSLMNLVRK